MLKFHREISVCNCWHIEALNPIRELPARCLHSSRAVRSARIPDPWHAATLHFVPWSGRNRGRWKGEAHNRYMRAQVILSSGTSSHPTQLLHTFHTSNTNMFKLRKALTLFFYKILFFSKKKKRKKKHNILFCLSSKCNFIQWGK